MREFFTAEELEQFSAGEGKQAGEGTKVFNALYVNAERLGLAKHCDRFGEACGRVVMGRTDLCADGLHSLGAQSFLDWEIIPYHHARGQLRRLGWESIYLLQMFQIHLLRQRNVEQLIAG